MQLRTEIYVPLIYLLAAVIYAWLGLLAWRRRPAVAVTPFAWTMLGMSVWSVAYGLEIFAPDLTSKIWFTKIEYIGLVSVPVFLFIFALEFIGKSHLLGWRGRFLLSVFPFITTALASTNDYHRLMWNGQALSLVGGLSLLEVDYGLLYWAQVVYSCLLVFSAGLLLIIELVQRPGAYRIQVSLIIIGILTPWLGGLLFYANITPINGLDFTPLFFLPTALGLSWAIIRYRLLEILPLEHITVLKNMADGVIVTNPAGRVIYINSLIEELVGRSETEVLGQPLNYISVRYGEKIASAKNQSELIIGSGDHARIFEVNIAPVSPQTESLKQSGPDQMIVLHDITERKKAETAISRRENMMAAISLAAEQFLKDTSWEHNVPAVLEKIGQSTNASRVQVAMNYKDEKNFIYTSLCYEWTGPGITPQINNLAYQHINFRQAGLGRWEDMLSEGHPISGNVKDLPAREQAYFKDSGSLSFVMIPIFVDVQWWGFIMLDECRGERHWTNIEMEAIHIAASIFGSAETRARTEQKLIRRQHALKLLNQIVMISLQADSVSDMAKTVVGRLGELINADGCFLTLWDESNKRTIPLAAYGPFEKSYSSIIPMPGELTFTESALREGHTLIIPDTRTTNYASPRIVKTFPSISILVLPLKVMDKRLGSVLLSFNKVHHFQPEEIEISEQASALIALALEKFQAVEHAQQRAATSETLRKVGAEVTQTLEINETVNRILEHLKRVIPYDTASVQVLDNNELEIIGGRGFKDLASVIGMRFPIPGNNPNTRVIETGKPYLLPDAGMVYDEFSKPPHNHIHSWLGVPLIFQRRIIGLLTIDSTTPNQFSEVSQNLVMEFANQVSVAIENSRIYKVAQHQATTDSLTGVYNRRGLYDKARVDFIKSISRSQPFTSIMIDLDHFKSINDTYGHAVGDQVLRELAKRCKSCVRDIDIVGRYGGEEFLIVLPDTSAETGLIVAERLRSAIANRPMLVGEDISLNVTASLGVAEKQNTTTSLEMVILRADQAMYIAKHKGRNRVAIST